jgi:hypothetical protein
MLQESLLCGCGAEASPGGLCQRCERRERHSRENFDGLLDDVLRRDGFRCRVCGEVDREQLVGHHRKPGVNSMAHLITLCRCCHARIHRTWRPSFLFLSIELLRRLWREVNQDLAEQRLLALLGDEHRTVEQTTLFDWKAA